MIGGHIMMPLGRCCLIVEDEPCSSLDLGTTWKRPELWSPGRWLPAPRSWSWIEHATPALVILDFKLRDGSCIELASAASAWGAAPLPSAYPKPRIGL